VEGTDNYHLSPLPANGSDSVALRCAWEMEPCGRLRKTPRLASCEKGNSGANPIRGRPWAPVKHLEQIDMNIVRCVGKKMEKEKAPVPIWIFTFNHDKSVRINKFHAERSKPF